MKKKADSIIGMAAFTAVAVGFAVVVAADTVDADHRVQWLPSVTEGYYNDPACWTDGKVPPSGEDNLYGYVNVQNNDVTIKAPPEGLVESSGTIFLGGGSTAHTLTIDTRGTFWEKRNVKAATDWWGTPFARNLSGAHVFNFENFIRNAVTPTVWRFDDALFTRKSQGNNDEFDLHSGTLTYSRSLYVGSENGTFTFRIHPEATLRADATEVNAIFYQRGNATTHVWFLGGEHSLNGITLKDGNSNSGTTWMHITNDTSITATGNINLGHRSAGTGYGNSRGILNVSDHACVTVVGAVYLGSGNTACPGLINQGDLNLSQHATFSSSGNFYVGYTQCSTGVVTVADDAVLTTGGFSLASYSNSWGRATFKDRAQVTVGGVLHVANGNGNFPNYGEVVVDDDATLSISPVNHNWMCMGSHSRAGSVARFTAKGRSSVMGNVSSWVEMGYGYDADIEFNVEEDAVVTFPGGGITNKVPVGGRSVVNVSSNAVLAVRGIRGGVPGTDDDCMVFNADGGTLKVSGSSAPPVPFFCGCASATIGANGLKFDSSGFDASFRQEFTAAAGAADATFTKIGLGTLTALADSSHPKTKIEQGTLAFGPGVTRFGDALEFAAGAKLELKDSTSRVEADSLAFAGSLQIIVPNDYTLDAAHSILAVADGISQEELAKIVVSNPEAGKAYELSLADEGTTLNLTVTAAAGGEKAWAGGAAGSWNAAAAWTPEGVPTHNDAALIGDAATISLSVPGEVGSLAVTDAVAVTISGAYPLYVSSAIDVTNGASLAVSAPIRNGSGTVEKGGTGTLTLSGDSLDTFSGNWRLSRGVTEFSSAAAIGADSAAATALAVSNCTFRYSGEAAEIERPWQLTSDLPSIFDIVGDLTFKNFKISHTPPDGGIVKLGVGALTLDMPSGSTTISWQKDAPRKTNADISGTFAPVNGETVDWNGLAQLTVLEGRLKIVGKGKTVTTVNQQHHGGIGGCGYVAAAAPELYLKDLSIIMGSNNGFHTLMGREMAAGSAAPKLILDNANATFNGLYVGNTKASGNADTMRPCLAVTNGTLNVTWNCTIPSDVGGIEPIVRIGPGGVLARNSSVPAGGLTFTRKLDVRVEDGGQIFVTSPQNMYLGGTANGEIVFANGGGMKVNRFLGQNGSSKAEIVMDGGYAEFTLNEGVSSIDSPTQSGFRIDAGGGEFIVGSGVSHALAVPLRGEGKVVKTGAGTLVLTNDLKVSGFTDTTVPTFTALSSATVKVGNTGGIEVAEGVLKCVAGTTDANSRFSGVGTLSGEFTEFFLDVTPGATDALTFSELTATKVTVDFGRMPGETFNWRDAPTAVVAKVATQAEFNAIQWRSVNRGDGMTVDIRYDSANGLAVAHFRPSGCALIFK